MKRLFIIRRGKRGEPVRDDDHSILSFPSKPLAKQVRDQLGGEYVVSYGPDHHKFKGV
jgi:hypothetical protein